VLRGDGKLTEIVVRGGALRSKGNVGEVLVWRVLAPVVGSWTIVG
jgi:hypothetical protein